MSKPKQRPFKKLYCDRPELLRLPGSALKVWLCHYMHEGQKRESWPSLKTICEEINLEERAVKRVRQQLLSGGWLDKKGERTVNGQFKVPIITVMRGVLPLPEYKPKPTTGGTKSHSGGGDNKSLWRGYQKVTLAEGQKVTLEGVTKSHLEVDPEKQVDPKRSRSKDQVEGADLSLEKAFCKQENKYAQAEALETKMHEPEGQKVTTDGLEVPVDPFAELTTSQIVEQLLPHTRGMELWKKYQQGDTYELHRAEIIHEVLQYQETQQQ